MKDQPAVRALAKLELERKLIDLAADPSRLERAVERSRTKPAPAVDALYMGLPAERVVTRIPKPSTCQPAAFAASDAIVILRHGRTEHNKLGLFTGWEDASGQGGSPGRSARASCCELTGFRRCVYTYDLRVIERPGRCRGSTRSGARHRELATRQPRQRLTGVSQKAIGRAGARSWLSRDRRPGWPWDDGSARIDGVHACTGPHGALSGARCDAGVARGHTPPSGEARFAVAPRVYHQAARGFFVSPSYPGTTSATSVISLMSDTRFASRSFALSIWLVGARENPKASP